MPDPIDLTVLDDIGVGDLAGLEYDSMEKSSFSDFWKITREASKIALDPPTGGFMSTLFTFFEDTENSSAWAKVFCEEVINALLKSARLTNAQAKVVQDSLDGIWGDNDYTQLIGCVFTGLVFVGSYITGAASGVNTHVVRGLNQVLKPNTGDLNDIIKGLFLDDPTLNVDALAPELGLADDWYKLVKRTRESRASVGDLSEQFRRGLLSQSEFEDGLKKLGYQEDDQTRLMIANANRIPNVGDIQRMRNVGTFDDGYLRTLIDRNGYQGQDAGAIEQSLKPFFNDAEIIRLWNANLLDEGSMNQFADSRGWKPEDFQRKRELAKAVPSIEELRKGLYREEITPAEFTTYLLRLGLQPTEADLVYKLSEELYSPSDLIRFAVREVFTPEVAERFGMNEQFPTEAVEAGAKIGITEETLRLYWAAHWNLPSPGQGFSMFHRSIIGEDDLKLLLRALDVMPFWADKMIELSFNVVPRRVVNTLFRDETITQAEFLDHYKQLGFSPRDSQRVLDGEIKRQQAPEREATKGDIIAAYVVGEISAASVKTKLTELGYTEDAITLILKPARVRRELFDETTSSGGTPDLSTDIPAAIRNDILTAYRKDLIGRDVANALLLEFGLDVTEVEGLLAHEDNDREFKDIEFKLKQLRRIFDKRADSDQAIADRLSVIGIVPDAQRRVMGQWSAEREADELIEALKVKNPTKTDLRDWLLKGIIDVAEWLDGMLGLGYDEINTQNFLAEIIADAE